MKFVRLICRNLTRNKRRNALTVLSIAVSLFIFSALASLPSVVNQVTLSPTAGRLVCMNKAGLTYRLPEAYRRQILAAAHVDAVAAETYFGGLYHDATDQFPNTSIDPAHLDELFPDWNISRQSIAEFKRLRTACLVGTATLKHFNWRVGQRIGLRGTIYPVDVTLQIVGTLGGKFPTALVFRRDYLQEILGRTGWADDFWIKLDRSENGPAVIARLDETFANSEFETRTETESDFMAGFLSNLAPIFTLARALALIVLATIAMVAANTAAMSVRERRAELAVMRSMGFSSQLVLSCLLAECALIGIAGGVIGCVAAYGVLKSLAVGSSLLQFGVIRMPPAVLALSLIMAVAIGVLSGLFPAVAAARRNIVDGLRMVA